MQGLLKPIALIVFGCAMQTVVLAQETTVHTPPSYNSTMPVPINYVRSWGMTKPTTDQFKVNMQLAPKDAKITTQYIDGLGRPLQTVAKQTSWPTGGAGADLVTSNSYDEYGRETRQYLPFAASSYQGNSHVSDGLFKLNPFQQQQHFYSDAYTNGPANSPVKGQGETYYYGKTEIEPSPLNRLERTYAPGNSWVNGGKGIKSKYWINTLNDGVRIWNVQEAGTLGTFGSYNTPATNGSYPAGELYKNVTEDEHGKQVIEFKDKEGKVILKKVQLSGSGDGGSGVGHTSDWLCTYYIYDDLGQLRCVIQPEGVKALADPSKANWDLTYLSSVLLNEQCFRYEYDHRGRMILKKVPGAAPVYMIYDKRDRLSMTQDGNMRKTGAEKWLVTLYDELNRPVGSGLWASNATWSSHAAAAQNSADYFYPFTDASTPSSGWEELTKTFYDNYTWRTTNIGQSFQATMSADYSSHYQPASTTTYPYPETPTQSSAVRGMVTGTKVKVLGSNPAQYLYTISYYDDKGRVIQAQSQNMTGGVDVTTTQYSFSGQALISVVRHQKGSNRNYTVITRNTYDDLGRMSKIEKKLITPGPPSSEGSPDEYEGENETSFHTTAQYSYDALGQLKTKRLSPDHNGTGLETLTYDYNIRGWMLGANRNYSKQATSGSNWFGFDLGYDKASITNGSTVMGAYSQPAYNGNIAGTVWKSKGDGEIRKYDYSYDNVNRLLGAGFTQYKDNGFGPDATLDFSVSNLSYDANGNILSQDQKGWRLSGSGLIDQLRYTYQPNSNKLQNVMDLSNLTTTKLGDFRYSASHPQKAQKDAFTASPTTVDPLTVTDYSYDVNGNLTKDLNKDIAGASSADGIEYNHLNLPTKVVVRNGNGSEKGNITYTYDAAGNKLKKVVQEGTLVEKTTLYMFGTYEQNVLQFFPHEEGRIRMVPVPNPNGPFPNPCLPVIEGFDLDGDPIYSQCPTPVVASMETFAFDYFLKDHLGNVRMVLTEEEKMNDYPAATMETNNSSVEESLYSNVDQTRYPVSSILGYPYDYYADPNYKVAKVNGSGQKIGPGIMLKVMSGDRFHVRTSSWYKLAQGQTIDPSNHPVTQLIAALAGGAASVTPTHGTSSMIQSSGILSAPVDAFFDDQDDNHTQANRPKAYLNWILLDEQFNYVQSSSSASQVPLESAYNNQNTPSNNVHTHQFINLPVTKNGYLYVFVSNETPNLDVFFDNLQVTHIKGPLLEETHYYPFGLAMAGISSKAAGGVINRRKFNYGSELASGEFSDGSGLEMYDTKFRGLDPQLGRWWQRDPLAEFHYGVSPYAYVLNNPLSYNDPLGLDTVRVNGEGSHKIKVRQGDVLAWTNGETTSYYTYDPKNKDAVNGFVGSGIQNDDPLPEVTVTTNAKSKESNSQPLAWAPLVGLINNSVNAAGGYVENFTNARTTLGYGFKQPWYKLKFYPSGWRGNQHVKTFNFAKAGKLAGTITFGIGTAIDAYGVYTYYTQGAENPNAVSPAKAGMNLGVGVYGLYGGPPGWIVGTLYFVTDAAYPGGVNGLVKDQANTNAKLNQMCGCDASAAFY